MKSIMKRLSIAAALLVLGVALACVYQAAGAPLFAGKPSVVVTVNLSNVLSKLNQRGDSIKQLKKMVEDMTAEDDKQTAELKKMETDMKDLAEGKDNMDLQDKLALTALKHQAWRRFTDGKIDIEASLQLQDVYRAIKTTVNQMATSASYDVVLVDDSQGDLSTTSDSRMPQEAQVLQQIAGRRMLYANPAIDITDDLIVRMNNDYRASGNKNNAGAGNNNNNNNGGPAAKPAEPPPVKPAPAGKPKS